MGKSNRKKKAVVRAQQLEVCDSPLYLLGYDVIDAILAFLTIADILRFSKVCRWTNEHVLPRFDRLPKSIKSERSMDRLANMIRRRKSTIQELTVVEKRGVSPVYMLFAVAECPVLRVLTLPYTWLDNKLVRMYAKGCRNLQSLTFCGSQVAPSSIAVLATGCCELQELSIYAANVTVECITALATKCPKLRLLSFGGVSTVTDECATVLSRNCTNLRSLMLDRSNVTRAIFSIVVNLKEFSVTGIKGVITPAHFERLVAGCPDLSSLEVSRCKFNCDNIGVEIVRVYPRLQSLTIDHTQSIGTLVEINSLCPGLKHLGANRVRFSADDEGVWPMN